MAYRVSLARDVRDLVDAFPTDLRRAWDLRLNIVIMDPLPRDGADFSIVPTENQWGDSFLTLVVDEFPFSIQYDVYPWPESEDNPLLFEGKVNIFRLAS